MMSTFTLPKLPYGYSALEPFIDAKTLMTHHHAHHQAYVDKLNEALANYPHFQIKSLDELLIHLDEVPEEIHDAVRNYGGGHFNHSLFWKVLGPPSSQVTPKGGLKDAIIQQLGDFSRFKADFTKQALGVFGSGYIWLCLNPCGELVVRCTANQDCPLSHGLKPIFLLDLWEHAYYLKHQNDRNAYLEGIWNIVNWKSVEELFTRYSEILRTASGAETKKAS